MAQTFTATYQIVLSISGKYHAKNTTVDAYISRTSPASMAASGITVSSATINMGEATFLSGAGNNPYLEFGDIGHLSVPSSVTDKSAMALTEPSGFSLNNLLDIGTTSEYIGIYASKSTSGNVVCYASTSQVLTITATCVQNYSKSTASVTPSVDAGSVSTVTFSNSDLSHVYHTVLWKFGSSQYSVMGDAGATGETYTIPASWLTNIPNALSGTAEVTVTTFSEDDVNLGSNSYSFTITAPASAKPSISLAIARIDNTVPSSWGIYVQGKSGIRITATAAGYQGSTVSSYTISGGATGTQTSNIFTISPITSSGTIVYNVKATDSRGRTATASAVISVAAYSPPEFTLTTAVRCTSAGAVSETGTYIKMTASGMYDTVSGHNTCTIQGQYGLTTSSAYSTPVTLTDGTALIVGDGTIDVNASYRVKFTLKDAFTTVEKVVYVGTTAYTVFFRHGGNGVAFGKASERENAVEINGDWGLYHGDTELTGTVPVSRGGTGATTVAAARNALGLGNTADALPIANGGTGQTTAAGIRSAIGLGNTTGAVPIANGGTGATTAAAALANLGAAALSHTHSADDVISGTIDSARLPFKFAYGSTSCSGSTAASIDYSSAGFTAVPVVLVNYSTTSANWSGDNGALKVHSKTTTDAKIIVGGSFSTSRNIDWFAFGV